MNHSFLRGAIDSFIRHVLGIYWGIVFAIRVFRPNMGLGTTEQPERTFAVGNGGEPLNWRSSWDRSVTFSGTLWRGSRTGCVVTSHGLDHDSKSLEPLLKLLAEAGYSVLTFDQRNCGRSGGSWWLHNLSRRYSQDLCDAVLQARLRLRKGTPVIVVAYSASTWPAVNAAWNQRAGINGLICDSGPTPDAGTALNARVKLFNKLRSHRGKHAVDEKIMLATVARTVRLMLGRQSWPPAGSGVPTVLLSGERDRTIPSYLVEQMSRTLPGSKLELVPNTGHVKTAQTHPDLYLSYVEKLFALPKGGGKWMH